MKQIVGSTCEVTCEDNGRKSVADILSFSEQKNLNVSINKSVKLIMKWNGKVYEGRMGGLSFITDGPKIKYINEGRK